MSDTEPKDQAEGQSGGAGDALSDDKSRDEGTLSKESTGEGPFPIRVVVTYKTPANDNPPAEPSDQSVQGAQKDEEISSQEPKGATPKSTPKKKKSPYETKDALKQWHPKTKVVSKTTSPPKSPEASSKRSADPRDALKNSPYKEKPKPSPLKSKTAKLSSQRSKDKSPQKSSQAPKTPSKKSTPAHNTPPPTSEETGQSPKDTEDNESRTVPERGPGSSGARHPSVAPGPLESLGAGCGLATAIFSESSERNDPCTPSSRRAEKGSSDSETEEGAKGGER